MLSLGNGTSSLLKALDEKQSVKKYLMRYDFSVCSLTRRTRKAPQMRPEFIMRLLDFPRVHLFAILLRNYGISAQYLGSDEVALSLVEIY